MFFQEIIITTVFSLDVSFRLNLHSFCRRDILKLYNQYSGTVCLRQYFSINLSSRSILLVGYITCAKWHNCVQADCNPSLQSPRRKQNNLRVDKCYIFFQSLQWITTKVFASVVFSLYDQLHFH